MLASAIAAARQQVLPFDRRIEAKAVALVGESSCPRRLVAPVGAHASHFDLKKPPPTGIVAHQYSSKCMECMSTKRLFWQKDFDMDLPPEVFCGVSELPLLRNAKKRHKKNTYLSTPFSGHLPDIRRFQKKVLSAPWTLHPSYYRATGTRSPYRPTPRPHSRPVLKSVRSKTAVKRNWQHQVEGLV
jgi:hypothetical protein